MDLKYREKNFNGTEKMWNNFIEPGLKTAAPIISAGVAAETRNPQSAQKTSNILKSFTAGEILPLTDMHGNGVRLSVM